jgi:transcriptional regulator with XRE-family HTH domain
MVATSNRLRTLRTAQGISLAKLGVEIGVHESTVSRWETGDSAIPDRQKVLLARFFGVSVLYLMGWDDSDPHNGGTRMVA